MAALRIFQPRLLARSVLLALLAGYGAIHPDGGSPCALFKPSSVKPKIAALIDGDQVSPRHWGPMLTALSKHGHVTVRKIYTTEHLDLRRHNIQPVVVPRPVGGKKDPNDMAITLDAAELALAPAEGAEGGAVSGIAVVSEDNDFVLLMNRLRGWGAQGYIAITLKRGGVPRATSAAYEAAGSIVVPYAIEKETEDPAKDMEDCIFFEEGKLRTGQLPTAVARERLTDGQYGELVQVLKSLGYLPAGSPGGVSLDALIKFFHVNELGSCLVNPLGLCQAFRAVKGTKRPLVPDPGNLMLLDRVGTTSKSNWPRRLAAGGPRLLRVSPALVGEVLSCLGFTDDVEKIDEDAVAAFSEANCRDLERRQVDLSGLTLTQKLESLQACFAAQHVRQRWRIVFSDVEARKKLLAERRIPREDAGREVVLPALRKYLTKLGIVSASGLSYNRAVISFERHRTSDDPFLRK